MKIVMERMARIDARVMVVIRYVSEMGLDGLMVVIIGAIVVEDGVGVDVGLESGIQVTNHP